MEARKKINYLMAAVLTILISFILMVGVSYGAKKPSPKPSDEPKYRQLTKKKVDQFLQRVKKNTPKRAARLKRLRKDDPAKFRETVRKALKAGVAKPGADTEKAANPKGRRGKPRRFAQMGRPGGGRGRGGRFAQMGPRRGGPGRGEPSAEMGPRRGGPGRSEQFSQMGWRRGGRGRGGRFAQMGPRRGGCGRGGRFAKMGPRGGGRGRGGRFAPMSRRNNNHPRGRRFGRTGHPRPDESDIWGDDDWYW